MIRIAAFLFAALLLAFLATPVKAAKVSYCAQAHDSAATRLKWALERQRNTITLQKDDNCRGYRTEFYQAAVTRQNITRCEQDDMRQSALEAIDAEINAFNDLQLRRIVPTEPRNSKRQSPQSDQNFSRVEHASVRVSYWGRCRFLSHSQRFAQI